MGKLSLSPDESSLAYVTSDELITQAASGGTTLLQALISARR
jgi:hypothetical protein